MVKIAHENDASRQVNGSAAERGLSPAGRRAAERLDRADELSW